MNNKELIIEIELLTSQLSSLPIGYISKKNINGKIRYYHQWLENKKLKSRYLKEGEMEPLQEQIELRRDLQSRLKILLNEVSIPTSSPVTLEFETNILTGKSLINMTAGIKDFQTRDCFSQLSDYLTSESTDRICLIFGLRRTGKTTLLRQAILGMTPAESQRTAYVKATPQDTMSALNRDLKTLQKNGYKYVFIDEITLIQDFIDSAALFSDIYAAQGMKIVLSGTDSLGFWFATHQELYDRAELIHTTFIPYREHSRLLGIDSIDEYIRYGGTLRAGETNFDDADVYAKDATFRDDETTRRYIDTAICHNIQHSLICCEDGSHFRHLYELYETHELTNAINRIIEDMNHRFLISVLTNDFTSHDLRLSARNLRNEQNADKQSDILDRVNTDTITHRLMDLLDVRNKDHLSVAINNTHITEIKEYLMALDLIIDCPTETTVSGALPLPHTLFTQPGMRYCQAQALVHSLMKDTIFQEASEYEKKIVTERILEEVRGRMTEDIILLETFKTLPSQFRAFKLLFAAGEFDMVIYDSINNTCRIFEIKHSNEIVPQQYRHLEDDDKCTLTSKKFGSITEKIVLYRGGDADLDNGIHYRNIEKYLKTLGTL